MSTFHKVITNAVKKATPSSTQTSSSTEILSTTEASSSTKIASPTQSPSSTQSSSLPQIPSPTLIISHYPTMSGVNIIGTPVTTILGGQPTMVIDVWNSTQLHDYQVDDKIGSIAAFSILGCFTLMLSVVFIAWIVRIIQRKRQPKPTDKATSMGLLPLTTISRTSLYAPLPPVNLSEPEPYDSGISYAELHDAGISHLEPSDAGSLDTSSRYYSRLRFSSNLNHSEGST